MSEYYIAKIRNFYGPREELSIVSDEQGERIAFGSVREARKWIDEAEEGTYVLASGEASRPEFVVVDGNVVQWLDMDDDNKYDWDSCPCKTAAGQPCGLCDTCTEHRSNEDIAYVRANATSSETSYRVFEVSDGETSAFLRGDTHACILVGGFHDVRDAADLVRSLAGGHAFGENCSSVHAGADMAHVSEAISKAVANGCDGIVRAICETGLADHESTVREVVGRSEPPRSEEDADSLAVAVLAAVEDGQRRSFVDEAVRGMGFEMDGKRIRVAKFVGDEFVEVL